MNQSRRSVLKQMGTIVGMGVIASTCGVSIANAEQKRKPKAGAAAAGGGDVAPLADPNSGVAKTLSYHHKKADVTDAKVKTERTGVSWDKQFCNNCMFFAPAGKIGSDEVGKCAVIAGFSVKSQGWCNSWSKKA